MCYCCHSSCCRDEFYASLHHLCQHKGYVSVGLVVGSTAQQRCWSGNVFSSLEAMHVSMSNVRTGSSFSCSLWRTGGCNEGSSFSRRTHWRLVCGWSTSGPSGRVRSVQLIRTTRTPSVSPCDAEGLHGRLRCSLELRNWLLGVLENCVLVCSQHWSACYGPSTKASSKVSWSEHGLTCVQSMTGWMRTRASFQKLSNLFHLPVSGVLLFGRVVRRPALCHRRCLVL